MKSHILRGVTDIPEREGAINKKLQEYDYKENTLIIMKDLFSIIDQISFR
jgi:hypothetical protein